MTVRDDSIERRVFSRFSFDREGLKPSFVAKVFRRILRAVNYLLNNGQI